MTAQASSPEPSHFLGERPHLWIALGFMLGITALLAFQGYVSLRADLEERHQVLSQRAETTAEEIMNRLDLLRQRIGLFAEENQARLQAVAENPDDEDLFATLRLDVKRHFPHVFGVAVTLGAQEPVLDVFSGRVGDMCLQDLHRFEQRDPRWTGPRIHPNALGYHFDIISRWKLGLFFVSVQPELVAEPLRTHASEGQRMLLTSRQLPRLIEVEARGSRDRLDGATHLDPQAFENAVASLPIPGTDWELVAIDNPQWEQQRMRQAVRSSVLLWAALITPLILMTWLVHRSDRLRREAQQANQFKSRFLSIISHDIRTPMNSMLGNVQLLEGTSLLGRQREQLQGIRSAADHMLYLLSDLIDMSRLEAGRLQLDQRGFALHQIIDNLSRIFAGQARSKGLDFTIDVESQVPDRLVGDPVRLQQILGNLLGNAIKFTDKGRVSMSVTRRPADNDRVLLRFAVQDTGIGIPEEQQAKLFDDYVQASLSVGRNYGGSGLGLAICRQLSMLMGGEMGIYSRDNLGSLFWVEVPLQLDRDTASLAEQDPQDQPIATGEALLVDDDPVNLEVTAGLLGRIGWSSRPAGNARQAVVELGRGPVDLVLLDAHLGDTEGVELIHSLRRLLGIQSLGPVPIFAVTGDDNPQQRARYLAAGFDDFIPKPLDLKLLKAAISRYYNDPASLTPSERAADNLPLDPEHLKRLEELRPEDPNGMLNELFGLFLGESKRHMILLGRAIETANWDSMRKAAHALRGCAGNVGAIRLVALARAIEQTDESLAPDEARAMQMLLTTELERVRKSGTIQALGGE